MKTIFITSQSDISLEEKSFTDIQTHFPSKFVEQLAGKNLPAGLCMLVDETGALEKDKKENSIATYFRGNGQTIYGDVFIVAAGKNDFLGLKNYQISRVMDYVLQLKMKSIVTVNIKFDTFPREGAKK